jgi:hypothetical protein
MFCDKFATTLRLVFDTPGLFYKHQSINSSLLQKDLFSNTKHVYKLRRLAVKTNKLLSTVLAFVLLLAVSVSSVAAQDGGPAKPEGEMSIDATEVNSRIGYQGVLKENGAPVNGTRDMIFRLYSNNTCTTQVGSDIVKNGVSLNSGLFNVALDVNQSDFTGDGLWVRVVIEGSPMGCTELLPAPYALSLKPGAIIEGASSSMLDPVFGVIADSGTGSSAILGMATGTGSAAGFFWQNSSDGYAVYTSGRIASSMNSYLWLSGNGLEKWHHDDTDILDIGDAGGYGGMRITGGPDWGTTQYVVMPVTIQGTLYGQDVAITALDLYWICSDDLMGVANIRLRRTIDANSYQDIIFSNNGSAGWGCEDSANTNGCTIHLTASSNNVLSSTSGILHLVIGLNFAGETTWNRIDGIRLTLEYQDQ